ncbi:MAG: NAD(+) diphosphatase [Gammaproteobacteria bacterium]|nr:NAD(+) diphosphatase [Gammaproteobacteria bacterium]MDH3757746.1 NAD(+) diphosphatase [Gammaproteobacteria bacterium]MDH3847081.1 NAD(+) diphosphatase [Gammaproteobacteria bacterium]MDH3862941.1 NAD(+) diphosphatase [Gammaproteobacteria bacterium]MDH3904996.1 NAD(+) diphosphatase [Gammaproteobacteria bacterium]
MQDHNVFAGAFVDRSGERRKDPEWLARAARSDQCRFVPVWGDRCLVGGDPPHAIMLERSCAGPFIDDDHLIFLGLFHDRPAFAFSINREKPPPFTELGEFQDLRLLGTILPPDEANLAAHARALVLWHASQMFCGVCGTAARPEAGGNTRLCMNTDCGRVIFPRVDPAIIVLVSDGARCLLGRQAGWPEGRYSTIAGFAEPGESLEDAVRREVYEETNVHVGEVRYHSSQPWPFPSSLMIGFVAEAISSEIRLNDAELEDAQWFTREELRSGFPKLPFRISIARRLVDHWIGLGD